MNRGFNAMKEIKKKNFLGFLLSSNKNDSKQQTNGVYKLTDETNVRAIIKTRKSLKPKIEESIYDEIDFENTENYDENNNSSLNKENDRVINNYDVLVKDEIKDNQNHSDNTKDTESIKINSSTTNLEQRRFGTRSKSLFVGPTSTKFIKKDEVKNIDIKRRAIIDVFRQIDAPEFDNLELRNDKSDESDYSENDERASYNDFQFKSNHNHNNSNEKNHHEKKYKEPMKSAIGFSIIYGLFICLLGIFLSLDSLAGELGNLRMVNTVFYVFLYLVSIIWIIYLFYDIKSYVNDLNKIFENENREQQNKLIRHNAGGLGISKNTNFYKAVSENGQQVDLYETRKDILKNYEKKNEVNLVDFEKKNFIGYLVDKNQPYNMYLTTGIGIFCMITLIQCGIEISEAIENFINGNTNCNVETSEAVIAVLQFVFCCMQFLFIFLRGNIVICKNDFVSHVLTMHLAMTNLIVWFKNILIETITEFYEHVLEENLHVMENFHSNNSNHNLTTVHSFFSIPSSVTSIISTKPINETSSSSALDFLIMFSNYQKKLSETINTSDLIDCHDYKQMNIKAFAIDLKPYLYPATIEFSVTCATIFIIMWHKAGKRHLHCLSLPPVKKNFEGVGMVSIPYSNLFIMLDCTKTSKGLFFGIIVFVGTLLSSIFFIIYNSSKKSTAKLLSEITEITLLVIALVLTIISFIKIRKHYSKAIFQVNMFDVVLELFSLGGVYAYSVNSLIAIFYSFLESEKQELTNYSDYLSNLGLHKSVGENQEIGHDLANNITVAVASVLSLIQGSLQTLLILECLRRYAQLNSPFMKKPARELITALLLTNIAMWFFDTISAKRFTVKPFLIDHFGILKWSIINAFSSPIAIFYRFHSSVCLSDIWYGLYYGEYEDKGENEEESEV